MRTIRALLNRLPHREALLRLLERELAGRDVTLLRGGDHRRCDCDHHRADLERLRDCLLAYPRRERAGLAAALAELLRRVQERGALFTPREQDGQRGRKWSADYSPAFVMEEAEGWLGKAREVLARGDDYTVALEPGCVAVTAGRGDFEGEVPDGVEITETVQIEKLPAVRIVPIRPSTGCCVT
jgi:hypothetical protein